MFVRSKRINGHEYAYLVENIWTDKGPRQKSRKYLGKIIRFEECADISFEKGEDVIASLVAWELLKHGFEEKNDVFVKEDIVINIAEKTVMKGKKHVSIGMHEGFLCGYFLEELYKEHDAYTMAKLFVEAGIDPPRDVFVALFMHKV